MYFLRLYKSVGESDSLLSQSGTNIDYMSDDSRINASVPLPGTFYMPAC